MFLKINDLKKQNITSKSITESNITISNDPINSLNMISQFEQQLLELKNAITYKKDKIIVNNLPIQDFDPLFSKFKNLDVKKIDTDLLNLNKELNEYKLLHKMLMLGREIDLNNRDRMIKIYEGDDESEWNFLALFLRYSEKEVEFFKKLKEKMIDIFQNGLNNYNIHDMRRAYNVLYYSDDFLPAINLYICNLKILYKEIDSKPPDFLDIDFYNPENTEFFKYLDEINLLYMNEFLDIPKIFENHDDVMKIINKRIFNDYISLKLENFMKTDNPILFLLNFQESYKKIKSLMLNIKENSLEIFDPYFTVAIEYEKNAINTIFNIINGQKNDYYILLGEKIKNKDLKNNFLKVLNYFNIFIERSILLKYDEDDINSVIKFFIKKLEDMFLKLEDSFEIINNLSEIYLILKIYFINQNLPLFEILSDFFQERLSEIFIKLEENFKIKINNQIKKINISELKDTTTLSTQKLIKMLDAEFKKLPPGRNGNNYIHNILLFILEKFRKQILSLTCNKKEASVIINDVENYIQFLKDHNLFGFVKDFKSLKEDFLLILVDENELSVYLKTVGKRLEKDDIKKILKCRVDYQDVKKYLKNI